MTLVASPAKYRTQRRGARDGAGNIHLILAAARGLPAPFTGEQLVVAAWERHPARFGLRGHLEHPDSNLVLSSVHGKRGLVHLGFLRRVAVGCYEVTELGRRQSVEE